MLWSKSILYQSSSILCSILYQLSVVSCHLIYPLSVIIYHLTFNMIKRAFVNGEAIPREAVEHEFDRLACLYAMVGLLL